MITIRMLGAIKETLRAKITGIWKELFWVGSGQAVAVAGSLVGVRVITHYLSPTVYGEMALALTGGMLLQNIFTGPCCNALQRFYAPAKDDGQTANYLRAGRRLFYEAIAASLVSTLIVLLGLCAYGQFHWLALVGVASIFALISGGSSAMDTIQNAARRRKIVAWHQGLGQWIRFLAVVFAVLLYGSNSLVALIGSCLGAILVLLSQAFFLRQIFQEARAESKSVLPGDIGSLVGRMRSYSWPFLAWGIFGWVQSSADRWALGAGGTAEDVGLFAVLAQLGLGPITMLSGLLVQLISPILYDRAGAGTDESRVRRAVEFNHRLFLGMILLTAVFTIAMSLLHASIFAWLTAPVYWKVSHLLPWIGLGGGLFAATQILSLSLLCKFDSRVLLWPKICTAVLATGLFFAVAPRYGVDGVVYSGLLTSAVYAGWIYYLTTMRAFRKIDDGTKRGNDAILYAK